MSDEGLHEIQLNGKQLVFLFMTATVVAVVIFLCGVMVGRGVPAQRGTPVLATEGTDPTTSEEARTASAITDAAATPTAASSPAASPSSKLGLTYPNRLEEPEPVAEDVPAGLPAHEAFATTAVAKVPPPAPAPKPGAKPAPAKTTAPAVATTTASNPKDVKETADAGPAGAGFVVQVAAVRQRSEADAIRGRLNRKGYPAFIATAGAPGAPTYRVRVGKYPSRREADTVAAKLEREEQFKPWVTR